MKTGATMPNVQGRRDKNVQIATLYYFGASRQRSVRSVFGCLMCRPGSHTRKITRQCIVFLHLSSALLAFITCLLLFAFIFVFRKNVSGVPAWVLYHVLLICKSVSIHQPHWYQVNAMDVVCGNCFSRDNHSIGTPTDNGCRNPSKVLTATTEGNKWRSLHCCPLPMN